MTITVRTKDQSGRERSHKFLPWEHRYKSIRPGDKVSLLMSDTRIYRGTILSKSNDGNLITLTRPERDWTLPTKDIVGVSKHKEKT